MVQSESAKLQTIARRLEQGFLPLVGRGIDVGAGTAHSVYGWDWWSMFDGMECRPWDRADGDAHDLPGVESNSLDWLYASHILEHLDQPADALYTWIQVVKPGGKILLSVPHRDLYEGRMTLPSNWNGEHVRFYVPERADVGGSPDTIAFGPWLRDFRNAFGFELALFEVGARGCTPAEVPHRHAQGEYCIDALLVKNSPPT